MGQDRNKWTDLVKMIKYRATGKVGDLNMLAKELLKSDFAEWRQRIYYTPLDW